MAEWLRKNWILVASGLVALVGIVVGVLAYMGFQDAQAKAAQIASIARDLEAARSNPANLAMIEEARRYAEQRNREIERAQGQALEPNKREPLMPEVFPAIPPGATHLPYQFRTAYQEAMRALPERMRGRPAPSGDMADNFFSQLMDQERKSLAMGALADTLTPPQPPSVPAITPTALAVSSPMAMDTSAGGRGMDPSRGTDPSRGVDPSRGGGRGMDPTRGGYDPGGMPSRPVLPPGLSATAAQAPQINQQALQEKAQKLAVYETARRTWTYVNSLTPQGISQSFFVHPILDSESMPTDVDMWGAQVYLWIQQDVVDSLARVNEQAAQTLPEDQQWVAYLPVKHLVGVGIGDYVRQETVDPGMGRSASLSVLGGSASAFGMGGGSYGRASMMQGAGSFTGRARTDQFDVVHFDLELVVDARWLPAVLNELGRQNFITPLLVRYSNVDDLAARAAGFLYGTDPVVAVTVQCEILFFRSLYEPMMPDMVKKILAGQVVMDPTGRGRGMGRGMY